MTNLIAKFSIGEQVYFIYNNKIIVRPVKKIFYNSTDGFTYQFLIEKKHEMSALPDEIRQEHEDNCFKSVNQLCGFYETKLKNEAA